MSDLPKLVVTREQAKTFSVGVVGLGASRVVLRLPERPTMPEGERVEVGWLELSTSGNPADWPDDPWHPVATATLAEVRQHVVVIADSPADLPQLPWLVTLTDVEAAP